MKRTEQQARLRELVESLNNWNSSAEAFAERDHSDALKGIDSKELHQMLAVVKRGEVALETFKGALVECLDEILRKAGAVPSAN